MKISKLDKAVILLSAIVAGNIVYNRYNDKRIIQQCKSEIMANDSLKYKELMNELRDIPEDDQLDIWVYERNYLRKSLDITGQANKSYTEGLQRINNK